MSYLHCPTCKRAFNMAVSAQCPNCPVPAQIVDPAEDIVAAAEQLSRAMARATPDERDEAMGRMDRLALPAPGAKPVTFHGAMLKSIREALDPAGRSESGPLHSRPAGRSESGPLHSRPPAATLPPPPRPQPLLAAVAQSLMERVTDRVVDLRDQLERRSPLFRRAAARMRALAA